MEIALVFLGITAGILSGLFGRGGGIVMVPVLVSFFSMELLNANAISLTAMLLPVGIMGVITYYKAGLIHIKDSLIIAIGLLGGSFIGGEIAINIDVSLLAKLYAVYLLYAASTYLFAKTPKIALQNDTAVSYSNKQFPAWSFIVLGLVAGITAGMFGKGGGLIIVPLLISFFKYNPKAATATSLAALQLPVGLPSVIIYASEGHLNLAYAAFVAIGIVGGTFLGSKFALKLPVKLFKRIYAVFLCSVGVYMVVKYL
ncbi:MAG: sulfite exporter TauE/SafE family protein [Bacteroidales bacterium]|jgi:uncharacterized membrane protein YfcA|nr:sulfite exporter TauE/SafE family protein [Bacteroidales bacterium]